MNMIRVNN